MAAHRPRPGENEDELLRMQQAFLASQGLQPAARLVPGMSGFLAASSRTTSTTPLAPIVSDICEKKPQGFLCPPGQSNVPIAFKVFTVGAASSSSPRRRTGKSLFAQQFDRESDISQKTAMPVAASTPFAAAPPRRAEVLQAYRKMAHLGTSEIPTEDIHRNLDALESRQSWNDNESGCPGLTCSRVICFCFSPVAQACLQTNSIRREVKSSPCSQPPVSAFCRNEHAGAGRTQMEGFKRQYRLLCRFRHPKRSHLACAPMKVRTSTNAITRYMKKVSLIGGYFCWIESLLF